MSATRNSLVLDYYGVNYDIAWNIIMDKLPDLNFDIQKIIMNNLNK